MNRISKPLLCIAAAAALSLTMMQTANAASWNSLSLLSKKYSASASKMTTNTTTSDTANTKAPTAKATATGTASTKSATAGTSTASGTKAATSTNSSAESQMLGMINEDRGKAGLKALKADSSLRAGALRHSQDMAQNNFFSHTSPTNGTFSQRAAASGAGASAENLAHYGSIAKAHAALMASEGHRKNLMNANYTRVGIGVVSSNGAYYVTQWFGR